MMSRTYICLVLAGLCVLTGCPANTAPPPEAALAGNWTADLSDGTTLTASFDQNGKLLEVNGVLPSGESAAVTVVSAASVLSGDAIEIRFTTDDGELLFTGTLSFDGRTISGTLSGDLTLTGAVEIVVSAGDLVLDSENDDDGDGDNMNDNDNDNENENDNATDDDDGNANDNDNDNTNDNGSGLTGDAIMGETLFSANCAVCHGADASGVIGPNIQGEGADDVAERVSGQGGHTTFDLSDQDVADIAAFLATLGS